ncbi:MAG: hypothetical protein OXN83_06285 [Oligoflexia bacterium]|nr:hypothetical protein [Oligoflexia bacterium]
MKNLKFVFQNHDSLSKPVRSKLFSSQKITRLIFISSLFVSFSFFILKSFQSFRVKNQFSFFNQISLAEQELNFSHIFPLLVNLKGQNGPQLARVYVYITLTDDENARESLFEDHTLEKQLLFLLSGQSVKSLKKKQFQNQIQSQLNAFLSDSLINRIQIQTEMLN